MFPNTPKLGASKGPKGEIIITKTYSNFLYRVTIEASGAIRVRHGDWLSKYSAAMYNDFSHLHEFGRMDKNGKLRSVHNINLIFTGETLYHLPTYNKAHPMRMDAIQCTASPLSDEQKMKHIVNTLKADFHISGEKGEQFENIVHYGVHPAEAGLEIAEIWGWVAEGAVAVTALQLTVAVLTPIVVGLSILNALDTDKRIVGRQAICYTVASWAFGTGIPQFPAQLRANFSAFPGKQDLPRVMAAWDETASATVTNLEEEAKKKKRSVKSFQAFWRGLGEGDPKHLVRLVMEAQAEEFSSERKDAFLSLVADRYPN